MFLTHFNNNIKENNEENNNEENNNEENNNEENNNEENNNEENNNEENNNEENNNVETKVEKINNIKKKNIVVIWFYATWCGHCNTMKSTWDTFSEKPPKDVKLAKIESKDYPKYKKSSNEKEIQGYPTIRLYHKDKMIKEYDGDRGLDSIEKFAKDYTKEHNNVKKNNLLIVRGKKSNIINKNMIKKYIKNSKKSKKRLVKPKKSKKRLVKPKKKIKKPKNIKKKSKKKVKKTKK